MCLKLKNMSHTNFLGHFVCPMTADALLSQSLLGQLLVHGVQKTIICYQFWQFCTNTSFFYSQHDFFILCIFIVYLVQKIKNQIKKLLPGQIFLNFAMLNLVPQGNRKTSLKLVRALLIIEFGHTLQCVLHLMHAAVLLSDNSFSIFHYKNSGL